MDRSEKIKEHLKSIACGILLLTMICLCVVYILSFSGAVEYAFSKNDMEALSSESIRYQYLEYWNASYVSPSFIGFSAKSLGDPIGFYTLGGSRADVYQSVIPFVDALLGERGALKKLDAGAGEKVFHALLGGDYIYLSWACDLPISLIAAMSCGETDLDVEAGDYIREMLIVPESYLENRTIASSSDEEAIPVYSFYAVARDGKGNYYRLDTDGADDVVFHKNFYAAYSNSETRLPYTFAYTMKKDAFMLEHGFSEKIMDTTVIPLGETALYAPIVFEEIRIPGAAALAPMMEVFLMNPEKVTSYTDEAGTVFYLDEGQNLSVTTGGILQYTAHETEGITLGDLFGWHTGEEKHDVYDYFGGALVAAHALKSAHAQTNSDLYISGVYYDGVHLEICFGYAVGGFPLYFDGKTDMISFVFSSGVLQSAVYHLRTVHTTAYVSELPDLTWALRAHLLQAKERYYCFYGYDFTQKTSRQGVDVLVTPKK